MIENVIAKEVVNSAFKIHNHLGPGLFESVYEEILAFELKQKGYTVLRQDSIPVTWKEIKMEHGFRADLIIENRLLVEIKSVEAIALVHKKQVLTYLRLSKLKLGLLINFNVGLIKDGISRIVNNL